MFACEETEALLYYYLNLSVRTCYNTVNMTDASVKKTAARIQAARHEKHVTQEAVATKAGVSISYYAQVERGIINPTTSKLLQIIEALGVESKDILGK